LEDFDGSFETARRNVSLHVNYYGYDSYQQHFYPPRGLNKGIRPIWGGSRRGWACCRYRNMQPKVLL